MGFRIGNCWPNGVFHDRVDRQWLSSCEPGRRDNYKALHCGCRPTDDRALHCSCRPTAVRGDTKRPARKLFYFMPVTSFDQTVRTVSAAYPVALHPFPAFPGPPRCVHRGVPSIPGPHRRRHRTGCTGPDPTNF